MTNNDEAMIRQLINELVDAWNRGDAKAYSARYLDDATFTNESLIGGTMRFFAEL